MPIQRLVITGSSGYLGSKLVEHYRATGAHVLGVDVQEPRSTPPDEFLRFDVTDPSLAGPLAKFQPDTVIHGAFAFQPMRDELRMRHINVGGTQNILSIVEQLQVPRLMVISSATAFGAWPDNPVPMDDSWPKRARTAFRYAADKTEIEGMLENYAAKHPNAYISWTRPAIIGGPGLDNYLSRFIFGMPFLVRIDGHDTPLQFVHEQDVTLAIAHILERGGRGGFNVGPPDWTSISEVARESGRRAIKLPYWLVRFVHGLAWTIHFPIHESPASFLDFARYPWVVAPERLQDELGYRFRYTCLETLREIIQARS